MRITLQTAIKLLEAAARAESREKKRARDARYRAKRKTSRNDVTPTQQGAPSVVSVPDEGKKLATFRGVTAVDLPGKDRATQSMNFFNLRRGTYPPKSAKIPGYLEGAELVEALRVWCGKWGGAKR